jgi:hypothetical protein
MEALKNFIMYLLSFFKGLSMGTGIKIPPKDDDAKLEPTESDTKEPTANTTRPVPPDNKSDDRDWVEDMWDSTKE